MTYRQWTYTDEFGEPVTVVIARGADDIARLTGALTAPFRLAHDPAEGEQVTVTIDATVTRIGLYHLHLELAGVADALAIPQRDDHGGPLLGVHVGPRVLDYSREDPEDDTSPDVPHIGIQLSTLPRRRQS